MGRLAVLIDMFEDSERILTIQEKRLALSSTPLLRHVRGELKEQCDGML